MQRLLKAAEPWGVHCPMQKLQATKEDTEQGRGARAMIVKT